MIQHSKISEGDLRIKIKHHKIHFGGNRKLKIYGTLSCTSGKRMKKENRVFFRTEEEALENGYRLCRHCMRTLYKKWKDGFIE